MVRMQQYIVKRLDNQPRSSNGEGEKGYADQDDRQTSFHTALLPFIKNVLYKIAHECEFIVNGVDTKEYRANLRNASKVRRAKRYRWVNIAAVLSTQRTMRLSIRPQGRTDLHKLTLSPVTPAAAK